MERIRACPIFETMTLPSFALTVFRLVPGDTEDLESVNAINRAFYSDLQTHPGIALTHTSVGGVFCVRFAVGSAWIEQSDIDNAWMTIRDSGEKALAAMKGDF